MFSRLIRWLQPLALGLAAIAILFYLSSQWESLRAQPWRLDAAWLAAALGLLAITWAIEIEIWRRLLLQVGGALPFWAAVRVWFLSAVVRYVPGNIWQPLSLTLYCARYGVAPEATLTSIGLYQGVILLAALPMAAYYWMWGNGQTLLSQYLIDLPRWLLLLGFAPVVIFLIRPQWLLALLNRLLIAVGRAPLHATLTGPTLTLLVLAAVVDWLLWGATFAAFTFGMAGDGAPDRAALAPLLISSYPIAYTIGFLSLITPSGFGVREGAFYLLLVPRLDGAVVTVVALAMRLWTTVFELLAALASAPFERFPARRPALASPGDPIPKPAMPPKLG